MASRTPWAPGAPALAAAARVVEAVTRHGQSADVAIATTERPAGSPDESAIRAISFGTLRWYLRLAPVLEELLERPDAVAGPVWGLLAVAAHQVEYSRNAPEATVHAAVDAARLLRMRRATGLVNAVLRRFVAERSARFARTDAALTARTAHPAWLVERLRAAWPRQAVEVLAANNEHPPMTLRVDLTRQSAASYVERLAERSIDAQKIQWCDSAVTLTHPSPVKDLPGFEEGWVSVQDAGAQVAANLLSATPGMRVLDACAAPGGKTGHILELLGPEADLTAIDIDADRTALIGENLERLQRTARVCVGDARDPSTFWDGRPFDRILVDAPCSSTGVIRRHPDIKLLRRASDLTALAATQLNILQAALAMLTEGGRVLYSTCSLLPEENEQVVSALLEAQPALRPVVLTSALAVPGVISLPLGVQLLPGAATGADGFYYACLEKTTTGA